MRTTLFAGLTALCLLAPEGAAGATLRAAPAASGPAITLGDLFEDAGPAAKRAVAPAPPPGRSAQLSVSLVAAAAAAGGLDWTPPEGLERIAVSRGGAAGAAARVGDGGAQGAPLVRRGEQVTLVFERPGLRITTRAQALGEAAAGQTVTLLNPQSDRTIEAVVTGPGAARVAASFP